MIGIRSLKIAAVLAAAPLCVLSTAADTGRPSAKSVPAVAAKAALEKQFAESLTGAALIGQFTIDGRSDAKKAGNDRYEIDTAERQAGNRWVITARIKYGKHDLKVPVALDVLWAGDTPVMTLDKLTVPGMGTFTARVMFFGDRYAGTWQHDAIGGHMWGRIEHAGAAALAPPPKTPPAPPKSP